MFLIITGLQQESKYLGSAKSFFTIRARKPTVLKLKYIIFNIAVCYRKLLEMLKECTTTNCYLRLQINLKHRGQLLKMKLVMHPVRSAAFLGPCAAPDHKTHHDFFVCYFRNNDDECILILVIYLKKTGFVHTKISNHTILYSS